MKLEITPNLLQVNLVWKLLYLVNFTILMVFIPLYQK